MVWKGIAAGGCCAEARAAANRRVDETVAENRVAIVRMRISSYRHVSPTCPRCDAASDECGVRVVRDGCAGRYWIALTFAKSTSTLPSSLLSEGTTGVTTGTLVIQGQLWPIQRQAVSATHWTRPSIASTRLSRSRSSARSAQ